MLRPRHLFVAWLVLAALIAPTSLFADAGDPNAPTGATVTDPPPAPPADPPSGGSSSGGGTKDAQSDPSAGAGQEVGKATGGSASTRSNAKASKSASAASSTSVSMDDFFFSPKSVTVSVGDSVTWVNNGQAPHNATGDGISTGTIDPGGSASHTFSSAGSFSYVCTIHPQMTASVTVEGSSGSGGGGGDDPTNSAAAPGDANGLPNTGEDVLILVALGGLLVGVGLMMRRRVRYPSNG